MNALRALTGQREDHPGGESSEGEVEPDIAVRSGPAAPVDETVTAAEETAVRSVPSAGALPRNPPAIPYPGLIGDESAELPPKGNT